MVRVEDVARAAGVSYGTASMALRGLPAVAEKTAERVRSVAEELGYRPQAAASVLAQQRSRHRKQARPFALACFFKRSGTPLHKDLVRACENEGYDLVRVGEAGAENPRTLSRALWNRGVAGILLREDDLNWEEKDWQCFDWANFSVVKVGRIFPSLPFHVVRMSAYAMFSKVVERVLARGYRRVLALLGPTGSAEDDKIRCGILLTYREFYMPQGASLELRRLSRHIDEETLRLVSEYKPDAVIVFPYHIAIELNEAGFRFPRDFALASQHAAPARMGHPSIAGCAERAGELHEAAVVRLHQLIVAGVRGFPQFPDEITISSSWEDGDSLPKKGS